MFIAISALAFAVAFICLHWLYEFKWKLRTLNSIPGPMPLPLVGNALEFGLNPVEKLLDLTRLIKKHGNVIRVHIGPNNLFLIVAEPDVTEFFMSSPKYLTKMKNYNLLRPWIGNGLLTSTGSYWQKRRKIITPTFHFKILDEFIPIFNTEGDILVEKLSNAVGDEKCDIYPYITAYALDVICETAMGTTVNAQSNSDNEYVNAVKSFCTIQVERAFSPWKQNDMLFKFASSYKKHTDSLKIMHKFTKSVIKQKRENRVTDNNKLMETRTNDDVGIKKRFAFLDLLLSSTVDGKALTDEDIREEVDTFMFEGHDTTASAICFALYELSRNPIIQDKAIEELRRIFGQEKNRPPTILDLNEMKYIELIIKETLRMYSTVPMFGRRLEENATFNGTLYPKGINILFLVYCMHRRPDLFKDPELFNPDRYLPENMKIKNPFTYVPFSAGPRNCIGQKFAMYELKATLSKVLRNFELLPHETDVVLSAEIILKSATGVCLKLKRRQF